MRKTILTITTALTFLLTGCASQSPQPSPTSSTPTAVEKDHNHKHESTPAGTETDQAQPHLVISTANGATIVDTHSWKILSVVPESAHPRLTTMSDGRHVLLGYAKENRVRILDAGSWTHAHGDHFHHYTGQPALRQTHFAGGKPIHAVSNAGRTAVFYDDEGRADLMHDDSLLIGVTNFQSVPSKGPHHGVVVPLANGKNLVSQPGTNSALPDTVELLNPDGQVEQSYQCAGLHGEAVAANVAAYGCKDSVLLIDANGQGRNIANPDKSGERVGGLLASPTGDSFLGDYGPDTLLLLTKAEAKIVSATTSYGSRAWLADGRFAALGTDGTLRTFTATGAPAQAWPVIGAWEAPKGHSGLQPGLAIIGKTAYITEPATGKLLALDLETGKKKELAGLRSPGQLVATNAAM